MKRYLVPVAALCWIALLAGCGGGGGATGGGRSYTGTLNLAIAGSPGKFDVTSAVVTFNRVQARIKATQDYVTCWTGSKSLDLLSSNPVQWSVTLPLGGDVTQSFDSLRVRISHVSVVSTETGTIDRDVDLTVNLPLDVRMDAGRTAALLAVIPLSAFSVDGDAIALDDDAVLAANNIGGGEYFRVTWTDGVLVDVRHLPGEIVLPTEEIVSGLWVSGDKLGVCVENPEGTGGKFYLLPDGGYHEVLEGTYEYTDASRASGTWQIEIIGVVFSGEFRTPQSLFTLTPGGWTAIYAPCSSQAGGTMAWLKVDDEGRIVDLYGGPVQFLDAEDPSEGATAECRSVISIFSGGHEEPCYATVAFTTARAGTYTFVSEHGTLPASGTWTLYVPGL